MSPRHKTHTPRGNRLSVTTTTTSTHKSPQQFSPRASRKFPTAQPSSSIPTLPDVHKSAAPSSGAQGGFLHTLLLEEEEVKKEGVEGRGRLGNDDNSVNINSSSSNGSRGSSWSKGKAAVEDHQGHRVTTPPPDGSTKRMALDTLTARSDKLLTATWPGSRGEPAPDEPRPKAPTPWGTGRHRSSKASSESSGCRLSGPQMPSRKRFKHRLIHGTDARQTATRRFSSPDSSGQGGSGIAKAVDVNQKTENDSPVVRLEEESSSGSSKPGPACGESAYVFLDIGKPNAECVKDPADLDQGSDNSAAKMLPDFDGAGSDFAKTPFSDSKQTLQRENPRHAEHSQSFPTAAVTKATTPLTSESPLVTNTAVTSTTSALTSKGHSDSKPTSEPFNQWTACRALDDTDNENEDDDNDIDNDHHDDDNERQGYYSRASETEGQDFHTDDGSLGDGRFSRLASSSNPARRKRPLLLPPIMLPPIYTVKPTPLIVRDDLYFATVGSRARRSVTDDEWDKLRDCRYLRIRTRRPVKV